MNITNKIKNDFILSQIAENFHNEVFVVGGTVRDFILDKKITDRDLVVVDEDAKSFSLKLAEFFDATFIPLDEENKIYRLVLPDKINYIDVTNPVGEFIEQDLRRRDLTINAIAVNIKTCEVLDVVNGIEDIENKCINCISEQNFIDDPLRLLRVYRFQALLGFNLSEEIIQIVAKYVHLIKNPAVERVNYEIMKLFSGEYAHVSLRGMDDVGLLQYIFPFVAEYKKVPPNTHHHLNLFNHCLETVRQIQNIYEISENDVKMHLENVDFGGFSRLAHLKLAGFMHDLGKYSTWTIEGERHRFIKHDDVGAKMAVKILKNCHFSNKQIDYISMLIKNHIYPSSVMSAPEITDKIMMRYVRKMDLNSIDAIILAKADRLSARGPAITGEIVDNNINSLNYLLNFYLSVKDNLSPLPKLLSGNEVMEILNIAPSKKLGEIMSALNEAQISGDVATKEHAVEFVKSAFKLEK